MSQCAFILGMPTAIFIGCWQGINTVLSRIKFEAFSARLCTQNLLVNIVLCTELMNICKIKSKIGEIEIEKVDKFRYLGSYIGKDRTI